MKLQSAILLFLFLCCNCSTGEIKRDSYFDDLRESEKNRKPDENSSIKNGSDSSYILKSGSDQNGKIQAPAGFKTNTIITPEGSKVNLFYKKDSESLGMPHKQGKLVNGKKLPAKGIGYIHVGIGSYGTDETITYLLYAISKVRERYKDTVDTVIGSLSKMGGGKFRPHKSHQNGRDVDIGYFKKGNGQMTSFQELPFEEIDIEKTWYLIEQLMSTGWVEFIFMNYSLQEVFYNHAKSIGYPDDELDKIFQYPKGKKVKSGLIRHSRGHLAHFHLRFKCSEYDMECQ
jgi:murein endopeptidase